MRSEWTCPPLLDHFGIESYAVGLLRLLTPMLYRTQMHLANLSGSLVSVQPAA